MPDGRMVIIPFWRCPTLRVSWRLIGLVLLGLAVAVGLLYLGHHAAVR